MSVPVLTSLETAKPAGFKTCVTSTDLSENHFCRRFTVSVGEHSPARRRCSPSWHASGELPCEPVPFLALPCCRTHLIPAWEGRPRAPRVAYSLSHLVAAVRSGEAVIVLSQKLMTTCSSTRAGGGALGGRGERLSTRPAAGCGHGPDRRRPSDTRYSDSLLR